MISFFDKVPGNFSSLPQHRGGRDQFAPRGLSRFPDSIDRPFATHAGFRPVPAKKGKSGIGWVLRGESSSRPEEGSDNASPAACGAVADDGCGRHIAVRTPGQSSPRMPLLAPGPAPSNRRSPFAYSMRYSPADIRTATRGPWLIVTSGDDPPEFLLARRIGRDAPVRDPRDPGASH